MNPLSGEKARSPGGDQPVDATAALRRLGAQRDQRAGVAPMAQPGGARGGKPGRGPRAGALAAMQPAAAIGHRRLAAGAAGARARAAAPDGGEIAGRVAIAQAATVLRRVGQGGEIGPEARWALDGIWRRRGAGRRRKGAAAIAAAAATVAARAAAAFATRAAAVARRVVPGAVAPGQPDDLHLLGAIGQGPHLGQRLEAQAIALHHPGDRPGELGHLGDRAIGLTRRCLADAADEGLDLGREPRHQGVADGELVGQQRVEQHRAGIALAGGFREIAGAGSLGEGKCQLVSGIDGGRRGVGFHGVASRG
jgi:hypothetical protein